MRFLSRDLDSGLYQRYNVVHLGVVVDVSTKTMLTVVSDRLGDKQL